MISPSSTVPSGKRLRQRLDLGKALGHQFLAARPDPDLAGALDDLAADAVVLPLDLPVADGPERATRTPRAARPAGAPGRTGYGCPSSSRRSAPPLVPRDERLETLDRRHHLAVGVAHHPLGHALGVDVRMRRQRALHQQLADADAKAAADQLGQQEAALRDRARASTTFTRAAISASPRPRSGSSRSSTHSASPTSVGSPPCGSTSAIVSARSPTAW